MRCEGGDTYLQYIKDVMSCLRKKREKIENYDFFIFTIKLYYNTRYI